MNFNFWLLKPLNDAKDSNGVLLSKTCVNTLSHNGDIHGERFFLVMAPLRFQCSGISRDMRCARAAEHMIGPRVACLALCVACVIISLGKRRRVAVLRVIPESANDQENEYLDSTP